MGLYKILLFCFLTVCLICQNVHATQEFVYMKNGRLYFPNGKELSLWGVNFQPCLSWEYNSRLKKVGVQLTSTDLKSVTDSSLDELQRMGVNLIRVHLTPADFTDADGNIVQSVYLDILDYMVAEASKRNIYVYISFMNHMGSAFVPNSVFASSAKDNRKQWLFDKTIKDKTKIYIAQLLNRTNPYLQKTYKSTPAIALWELINEPDYYSYTELQKTAYYNDFQNWITVNKSGTDNATTYAVYRKQFVLNYLNEMYVMIRSTGATQPIVWNCNWHKFRKGNEDVFSAIAQSNVEVVSFCNYPGQDLVAQDYGNHPIDLSASDYTSFFKNNYNDINGYGWALSPDFKNKAKVVYEFEEFFNQSSYVYPLQALYFRSLGVQVAAMWTYCLSKSAPYIGGSHFLSLTCTPAKAVSFMVAHEMFDKTPLYTVCNLDTPNEQTGTNFALSKARDLSMFISDNKFYYTGDITYWCPIKAGKKVTDIVGRGNSSFVTYNGTGIYTLNEIKDELFLTIEPNSLWLRLPWQSERGKNLVTQLDYTTTNSMSIMLNKWKSGSYNLFRINGEQRQKVAELSGLNNISITPGSYVIVRFH